MIPDVSSISAMFRLPNTVGPDVLTGPTYAANKMLRQLVGDTTMNTADANGGDIGTLEILKLAGNYFGMYFAAPAVAARIRTDGQIITETSETAHTLRYATAEEQDVWRAQLWSAALAILKAIPGLLVIEAETEYVTTQRTWQMERSQPSDVSTYPPGTYERVM